MKYKTFENLNLISPEQCKMIKLFDHKKLNYTDLKIIVNIYNIEKIYEIINKITTIYKAQNMKSITQILLSYRKRYYISNKVYNICKVIIKRKLSYEDIYTILRCKDAINR